MKFKHIALIILALSLMVAGTVSAQDVGRNNTQTGLLLDITQAVMDETGLPLRTVIDQLYDGLSFADIIVANGGNVDVVIANVVAVETTRINDAVAAGTIDQTQGERLLGQLENLVTRVINGGVRSQDQRDNGRQFALAMLMDAVRAETGLDNEVIREQMQGGSTLSGVIVNNGGDVATVVANATAAVIAKLNELVANGDMEQVEADQLLENLDAFYTNLLNGELPERENQDDRGQQIARGVVRSVADATGLTLRQVVQELQAGATLSQVLTDNGVDVQIFIDDQIAQAEAQLNDAVEAGRITQAQADRRLDALRENLPEWLERTLPAAGEGGE